MCFTKSYSRYLEGTGSVFCPMTRRELNEKITEIEASNDNLELKKALKLRFFTSTEVTKLMSFPPSFTFPDTISEKQRYKLLGNSINVLVVSELIKLLVGEWRNKDKNEQNQIFPSEIISMTRIEIKSVKPEQKLPFSATCSSLPTIIMQIASANVIHGMETRSR
jgi:hypothetical protein